MQPLIKIETPELEVLISSNSYESVVDNAVRHLRAYKNEDVLLSTYEWEEEDACVWVLGKEIHSGILERTVFYENADYTIRSAAALIALYGKMGKSPKVYLFDEGLIHTLVKLCADCMIRDEVFLEMAAEAVKSVRGEWTVVCNEISPEQCMASIRARDRHICTFDELSDSQLEMILAEYERLNECYSAHYPVLKVNRSQELQTRTDLILRGIGKL